MFRALAEKHFCRAMPLPFLLYETRSQFLSAEMLDTQVGLQYYIPRFKLLLIKEPAE